MASGRFNSTNLHQRDARSALFSGYTPTQSTTSRHASPGPGRANPPGGGYGYAGPSVNSNPYSASMLSASQAPSGSFRPATPNRKGQYSDSVLNELESQNDAHVDGILGKVRVLKQMTHQIGDEIRESSALAEKINDAFDNTRVRLRGTMNRMLIMAERTGVGWKVWLGFFALVVFLFWYVWLF